MTAEGQSDKMVSNMEVRMKQRCVIEFLHAEKISPSDIHRHLLHIYRDQTVDDSTVRWWLACFSSGDRMWKTSHVPEGHAQLLHHKMKSISISSSTWIGGLWLGNCVRSSILASACWKQWWQCWNIAKYAPDGSHKCSHRNIKNTVWKFVRTYWTKTRLKVTVSWITSSPVMRHGVTTMSRSQNSSPWSGDMWIPHQRKSSRPCCQRIKWCALSFGIGKGWSFWISLNLDKPSTLTATLQCWL